MPSGMTARKRRRAAAKATRTCTILQASLLPRLLGTLHELIGPSIRGNARCSRSALTASAHPVAYSGRHVRGEAPWLGIASTIGSFRRKSTKRT